ncbi:T9SS type A sorting domain-containing protein [Flavobacterium nitrogenifigens]|nr:T9SS type A sorting domain-containing protein [Flavobacterium nitrogenifigens]KAF2328450.1 T9SS type A sorting domain-containing protein [Flavobacterium nitrogenifigens]
MKTKLHLFLLLLTSFSFYAQSTLIPDLNFENKLIKLGIDSGTPDGKVLTSRIANLTTLDVSSSSINNLTGIQDFVRLVDLKCYSNNLVDLDLSKNTVLKTLNCDKNKLIGLNLDKNVALTSISCEENQIKSLDVSRSTSLITLYCKQNEITSLDLSKNIALTKVNCAYNKLTLLNVSKNVNLTQLECERNQLTSLDLNSPNLAILSCAYNKITILDVSKNPKLTEFSCNNNSLTYLNLHNLKNTLLTYIDFTINPDLDCIVVDNLYYSNANWPTKKDDTANYVPFCGVKYTLIPDRNFEQKLVSLGLDDEVNGAVLTEKIVKVERINVSELHIQDLTGIEDFKALTSLNCSHNQITNLNVSKNILLSYLNCSYNYIATLDITKNTLLNEFDCHSNRLTALDVSKNLELHYLDCGSNKIVILDISKNYDLRQLSCGLNKLLSLNLKNGNNGAWLGLSYAYMRDNPNLTCIQLDERSKGYEFKLYSDPIAKYSSNCPTYTMIPDSNFEDKLIALKIDTDGKNGIVATSSISGITSLDVSSSFIADLTGIQDFIALTNLNCSSNLLKILDVSNNSKLTNFSCSSNQLISLNLKNGNNTILNTKYSDFKNNPNLTCIKVDNPTYSNLNWATIKNTEAKYATDCATLGLDDSIFVHAIMYPNPTKGEININNIALDKATVYNSLGQLVKSFTLNNASTDNTIDLSGLVRGVYYVYLINGDAASAKKIILE